MSNKSVLLNGASLIGIKLSRINVSSTDLLLAVANKSLSATKMFMEKHRAHDS